MYSERCFQFGLIASLIVLNVSNLLAQEDVSPSAQIPTGHGSDVLKHLQDGDVDKALDLFGSIVDSPAQLATNDGELASAMGGMSRALTQLSDEEQFELLYKWTMPTDSRKSVRILTSQVPLSVPPKVFARALGERPRDNSFPIASIGSVSGLFSTGWSLVQAASETGRLQLLTTELQRLSEEQVPNAAAILLMAHLADSNRDVSTLKKSLGERAESLRNAIQQPEKADVSIDSSDIVLAAAALDHEELRPISEAMFNALVEMTYAGIGVEMRPFLRLAHATAVQLNQGESGAEVLQQNRLKYWVPSSGTTSTLNAQGAVDATWLVHEDHVLHLAGSNNDALFFRYPLVGNFEFRCEAQVGGRIGTDGGLVYGGLQFQAQSSSKTLTVWDSDVAHSLRKTCPFVRHEHHPTFNRLSIRSTPEEAILTTNLHPMWFDRSSAKNTSPWLGLRSFQERRPIFRNFAITGTAVIPREVRLSDGNSLRGWKSYYYGESQPTFTETSTDSPKAAEPDWSIESGVITAARMVPEELGKSPTKADSQSLLHYQRPLLNGESVTYDFHYKAGEYEVHPAIGRLAFLIEPTGVRIHWMTDGRSEWTGLQHDNAVLEPLNRKGPRPLPLNENAWNTVTLTRMDDKVRLSLNDNEIYERDIDFGGDLTFGFYRDRTKSTAKIRNVIMTGDWPEKLPEDFVENPAVVAKNSANEPNSADSHLTSSIYSILYNELYLAENVYATRERAAEQPVVERYEFLKSWVLPSEFHSSIRMNGAFTQTEPASIAVSNLLQGDSRGGELVSPVFDLIDVAEELGKLDELRQSIVNIPSSDIEYQQRAKAALIAMVNLEMDEQIAASEATVELYHLVSKYVPTSLDDMWPETLLVYREIRSLDPNPDVVELLSSMDSSRTSRSVPTGFSEWHAHISTLMHKQQETVENRDQTPVDLPSMMNHWIPVERKLARTRGNGAPVAEWSWNGQDVRHRSSHDDDFLFYRSPLRGNFEVEGNIIGYGKTQILAGGQFFGPQSNTKQMEIGTFRKGPKILAVDPPFTRFNPSVHFRVVFRDGICEKYINGRLVLAESLPEHYDPWLGFRCWYKNDGGFRNVRISGTPQIPKRVAMSASKEMIGWLSYFEQSVGRQTGRWQYLEDQANGNEIIGRHARGSLVGTYYESLLRYHRPLVEDGTIEYEFFYKAGQTHTHPALDRLAFMLEPSGVRVHAITDGVYDRTETSPENMSNEPQNRRGPAELPLIENEWNHMAVRMKDNTLLLELNGQLIFQRELAATNRRTFGLFHFPGQTEVRARNVFMQGDWPQSVPSAKDQKFVDQQVVELDADLLELTSMFTHDFAKDGLSPHFFKTKDGDRRGEILATSAGISVSRPARGAWVTADIQLPFNVYGDYDIEVGFDNLILESNKDSCIMLITHIDDEQQTICRNTRIHTAAQRDQIHPSITRLEPDGSRSYHCDSQVACEAYNGRLRLARRGKTVYYLFAENDSNTYQIVGREEISDRPVRADGVQLRSLCNGEGETRVIWKDITIKAERLTYLPRDTPAETKSLYKMNSDGTDLKIVTKVPNGFTQFGSPEWSADSQQITFDASNGSTSTSHIMVINADGSNLRDLGMGCMPSFSADGKRIVFSQPGHGIVLMNSDGTERDVIDRSGWGVQYSPDGKYIAYGKSGNITIMDPDTRESRLLFVGDQTAQISYVYWNLGWSHDSRSICAKIRNRQTREDDLIVADIDSPDGFKVLHSGLKGINPDFTWGPENKNVLFAMQNPAHKGPQLFLSNRANPAAPTLLPGQPLNQKIYDCAWSPDGRHIVFSGQKFPQAIDWPPVDSQPTASPFSQPE